MNKIFISIINYNGAKDTLECLQSLDKILIKNIELKIIVVDNKSSQKFEIPTGFMKTQKAEVIYSNENKGFSGGNNLVIKKAIEENANYVLLLNNDTIVDKNFLQELIMTSENNKNSGVVAPKIYFAKGFEYHKDSYKASEIGKVIWYAGGEMDWKNVLGSHKGVDSVDKGQFDREEQTDFASGCCMLIRMSVLKRIGLLDERYFLYYEDNDLQERIKKAGFFIVFSPKSIIWHKNAGSTGGSGSTLQDYFISRNRLLFGITYAPLRAKLALLRESFVFLMNGRKYQKKGVRDFYLRRFGKGTFFNE